MSNNSYTWFLKTRILFETDVYFTNKCLSQLSLACNSFVVAVFFNLIRDPKNFVMQPQIIAAREVKMHFVNNWNIKNRLRIFRIFIIKTFVKLSQKMSIWFVPEQNLLLRINYWHLYIAFGVSPSCKLNEKPI